MLREVVMWEGGEMLKFFPRPSSLHPSQDPPGPPDSPPAPTPACSPVHERDNIYAKHKELGSSIYVPHLFALEADFAASSSAPFLNIADSTSHDAVAVAFWYLGCSLQDTKAETSCPNVPVLRILFACLPVFSAALGDKQETSDNPNVRRDHLSLREQISSCRRGGLAAVPLLSWSGPCSLASGEDKEAITPSSFTICSKSQQIFSCFHSDSAATSKLLF